jgi:predicted esterase
MLEVLMKKLLFGLCMLALVPFFGSAQQVARYLTAADGEPVGFYEFKPSDYNNNPNAKYPLIIFLHGIGERGDDAGGLANVLNAGIPHYINMGATMRFTVNGQTQSFLVLSPQLNVMYGSWQNFYVDEMLNYAKANLRVDPNRIYLTGLSLGGGGTWKYASASVSNASTFAAIVPVCGTCDYSNLCNITQASTPVWAFHALDDGVVGVGCTQGAISMLQSCGSNPKVTYYPSGNHYIWDQAYDTTHNIQSPLNVFEWMLTQSRNGSSTPPGNIAPVANAGPDQTITLPANSANLAGSGYDQDGSIASYNWTQVSGPNTATMSNASGASNTVGGLVAGTYVFRLKVTDNAGATGTDDINVVVNAAGVTGGPKPVAVAGSDQTITLPTNTAFLVGSASYVPNGGTITAYSWSEVSGPNTATITTVSGSNVQASNMVAGTYVYRLTVTSSGGSSTADMKVTVNGNGTPPPPPSGGSAPVAVASPDQTLTLPNNTAYLAGSGSYAPNGGTISSYAWSQVSGPNTAAMNQVSTTNVQVANMIAGAYTFRLTVTGPGGSSTADMHVTVNGSGTPPPPPSGGTAPVAVASPDQTLNLPTNTAYLAGSGSYVPGGGTISSYAWSQVNGPNTAAMNQVSTTNVQVGNMIVGTYTFRLTVTGAGGSSTADMHVTVNGSSTPPPPPPTSSGPTAGAGPNQTISLPTSSVFLYGSSSYDNSGGYITNYSWSELSGPTQANLGWLSNTNVNATNLAHGVYTFQLTVTNNKGQTGTATTQVTVN